MNKDCPFTLAHLQTVLGDPPDSPRLQDLLAHLESGCSTCLSVLEQTDGKALLETMAGPELDLPPSEADRLFDSIRESLTGHERESRRAEPPARVWLLRWVPVAAAALVIVVAGILLLDDPVPSPQQMDPGATRIKSDRSTVLPLSASLRGFAGQADPESLRPHGEGQSLDPGEVLFFRVDLSAAAFVYLLHAESRQLLYFPDAGDPPWPAGEHELSAGGRALALDGRRFPDGGTLLLVASPTALSPQALEAILSAPGAPAVEPARCPDCAYDKIQLGPQR